MKKGVLLVGGAITLFILVLTLFPTVHAALSIDEDGSTDIIVGTEENIQLTKTTNGGNVTITNIETTVQTTHWAAFLGNITATIALSGNQATNIFEFSLNSSNIDAIAATTDEEFDWGNLQTITASDADLLLNQTTNAADSVTQSFINQTQTYQGVPNFLTMNLNNMTTSSTDWPTSVGADTASPSFDNGLDDAVFIAKINDGSPRENFMGGTAEYQMIVGVNDTISPGADVEVTYNFWLIET